MTGSRTSILHISKPSNTQMEEIRQKDIEDQRQNEEDQRQNEKEVLFHKEKNKELKQRLDGRERE